MIIVDAIQYTITAPNVLSSLKGKLRMPVAVPACGVEENRYKLSLRQKMSWISRYKKYTDTMCNSL